MDNCQVLHSSRHMQRVYSHTAILPHNVQEKISKNLTLSPSFPLCCSHICLYASVCVNHLVHHATLVIPHATVQVTCLISFPLLCLLRTLPLFSVELSLLLSATNLHITCTEIPKGLCVHSAFIHRKLLLCFFSFSLFFIFYISHNDSLSAAQLYPHILPLHRPERSKLLGANVSMTHGKSLFILQGRGDNLQ